MSDKQYRILVSDRTIDPAGLDLLREVAELDFLEGYAAPEAFAAKVDSVDGIFCRFGFGSITLQPVSGSILHHKRDFVTFS